MECPFHLAQVSSQPLWGPARGWVLRMVSPGSAFAGEEAVFPLHAASARTPVLTTRGPNHARGFLTEWKPRLRVWTTAVRIRTCVCGSVRHVCLTSASGLV